MKTHPLHKKTCSFRDLSPPAPERAAGIRGRRAPPVVQGSCGGGAAHHAGGGEPLGEKPRGVPRRAALPPLGARRAAHRRGARLLPKLREGFDALAAAVETIRECGEEAESDHRAAGVHRALAMPRLAEFSKREPKIELHVFASSKMVDAGALDSTALVGDLDLRMESSAVQIHLGAGNYPGHRADRLFGVAIVAVASPDLEPGLKAPRIGKPHLLHDEAMEIVAGGNAWRKWLDAGVADRVDADRGPHFSSNILSLEAASQKLGVALALRPLVNADIASGGLCALRHRGEARIGVLPGVPGSHRRPPGGRRVSQVVIEQAKTPLEPGGFAAI